MSVIVLVHQNSWLGFTSLMGEVGIPSAFYCQPIPLFSSSWLKLGDYLLWVSEHTHLSNIFLLMYGYFSPGLEKIMQSLSSLFG